MHFKFCIKVVYENVNIPIKTIRDHFSLFDVVFFCIMNIKIDKKNVEKYCIIVFIKKP